VIAFAKTNVALYEQIPCQKIQIYVLYSFFYYWQTRNWRSTQQAA